MFIQRHGKIQPSLVRNNQPVWDWERAREQILYENVLYKIQSMNFYLLISQIWLLECLSAIRPIEQACASKEDHCWESQISEFMNGKIEPSQKLVISVFQQLLDESRDNHFQRGLFQKDVCTPHVTLTKSHSMNENFEGTKKLENVPATFQPNYSSLPLREKIFSQNLPTFFQLGSNFLSSIHELFWLLLS